MNKICKEIQRYMQTLHPIIYINHFDFHIIDQAIKTIATNYKCSEFNNAFGYVDFATRQPIAELNLNDFLKNFCRSGFDEPTILILKDIHRDLENNPAVIAYLRRIAEDALYNEDFDCTVFILSQTLVIPKEIENYITIVNIPLPCGDEIKQQINTFLTSIDLSLDEDSKDELTLAFKGLNNCQITQILNLAYFNNGELSTKDTALILREKEKCILKTSMLESIHLNQDIDEIGGLSELKSWLLRKAQVFANLDKALKFGVDIPKGIMLVGIPGCGKSLAAKATATLFQMPLIRLDIGRLLGQYVGQSEQNMRNALQTAEAISPCVLWIDELEKAFNGIGSNANGHEVTARLFGQFLTWMQEKEGAVFIVATANDISQLPPEFLRKGRFDELFFVDLPNLNERENILKIHLTKRNKFSNSLNLRMLANETNGFNGADLESVVKEAIEKAFISGHHSISDDDLLKAIKNTKSISQTLKNSVDELKLLAKRYDMKRASKTSYI